MSANNIVPEPTPVIRISDLTVSYPVYGREQYKALNGIDLAIWPREVVGLVGEAGAGKTLLARTLVGAIPGGGVISSGTMSYRGVDMANIGHEESPVRAGRDIGLIVSHPKRDLNPVLTVGEQIMNVIRHHLGLTKKEAYDLALVLLKSVSIPDAERRMNAWPHELSGGMAQRVVIAIALACNPSLLISDDATSALDVTVQTQVLELLQALVKDNDFAALFITRDIALAAHFCDRIVILFRGEIVETASSAQFFDRPLHPYSINLLAAFAHNPILRRAWMAEPLVDAGVPACHFADRCVRRQERCISEVPELRTLAGDRKVRCHFPVEG